MPTDTRGFDRLIADLTAMSGTPRTIVLKAEVARVLEICVRNTKVSHGKDAQLKTRLRVKKPSRYVGESGESLVANGKAPRDVRVKNLQTLTGTRGGTADAQWLIQGNRNGKRFFVRFESGAPTRSISQWNRNLFARLHSPQHALETQLEPQAEVAVKAIGSIAKSWVQAADAAGIDLRGGRSGVPGYVTKAQSARNDGARSRVVEEDGSVFIEVINTNALLASARLARFDGPRILQGAINTRLAAFNHELRMDVFANLELIAKRHPGVFLR